MDAVKEDKVAKEEAKPMATAAAKTEPKKEVPKANGAADETDGEGKFCGLPKKKCTIM